MKDIEYELVKKGWPKNRIKKEARIIKKAAKEISQDSGVPINEIALMILENIKYVGTDRIS